MENKMESMEIKKLVINMSLPIIISMVIQALYNIVDSMFVAGISQDALLSVSLCYPVQTMIIAVACGTGVGFNTVLSRYLGEKNKEKADHTTTHGIVLALLNWLVFALLGMFFADKFISLFASDANIIAMGSIYTRICTMFSFGVFIQITYERIMQATGHVVYSMIMQGTGAVLNIILDPILIYGLFGLPAMGVAGAAIATVLGQMIAMTLGIIIVQRKIKTLHVDLRHFRFSKEITVKIYQIGIPAILMQSIMSFMTVFMNMILGAFSQMAISVFNVYFKLQQFVFMAVAGMTNALIPIVAYNYGARHKERIIKASDFSLLLAAGIMLFGMLIFQFMPKQLLSMFQADAEMYAIGVPALRIISISFIFAGISMVLCSVFQALDLAKTSLIVTLLRQMVLLLPLTFILAELFGLNACWWAFPITELICAFLVLIFWKKIKDGLAF